MALVLTPTADAAIRAHGRDAFPHECCGALLGRDGVVQEAFALPNTTEEGPRRRFLVRAEDYRVAETRARGLRNSTCSASIIRIRITRRSRRNSISTMPGRRSRT